MASGMVCALLAIFTFTVSSARAHGFPDRPIALVVGYPPGGAADMIARVLAPSLGEKLGTTVVVENRAGANGTIGANHVAKSKPDGHTLLLSSLSPMVLSPQTMSKPPYQSVSDFAAINMVGLAPEAIALGPNLKIKTLKELLVYASKNQVTLASSGVGGLPHLTIELLKQASEGNIVHVAYKGAGPAITDTLGGHTDGIVMDLPPLYSLIKDNRLHALAVTSETRSKFLPDLPTAMEELSNFNVVNWVGVFAPANTSSQVITRIDAAIKEIVAADDFQKKLTDVAMMPSTMSGPAAFQNYFNGEYMRWGAVLKESAVAMQD